MDESMVMADAPAAEEPLIMEDGNDNLSNEVKFVGAIDQGTTSTRFMIFSDKGEVVVKVQEEFPQIHPEPGWHEQDPREIYISVERCLEEGVTQFLGLGFQLPAITAIGISNQRETFVLWDRRNDELLHNAIVWTDTRTSDLVRSLKAEVGRNITPGQFQELSGLPLSTYPSAVKLFWLLRENQNVRAAYEEGRLMFGTIDTYLIYRLTGRFVTDSTNASRTGFMNLRTRGYDDDLLRFFNIDRAKINLPRIMPSSENFGTINLGPLRNIPIHGCLGDQSAALVGHMGFGPDKTKNTYGTGCFLMYNVGPEPVISSHGLISTIAYDMPINGQSGPMYALEGGIAVGGSGITFLDKAFGLGDELEIDTLAFDAKSSGGVVFVTAFSGLLAPYWTNDAQGTIFGLTNHTHAGHIAYAMFESMGFQTRAIMDAMEKDSGKKGDALAVDGGMSNSDIGMQIQCDITGLAVFRPNMLECSALGAAIAAGIGAGVWTDPENQLRSQNRAIAFESEMTQETRDEKYRRWNKAVELAKGWLSDESGMPNGINGTNGMNGMSGVDSD